MHMADALVSPGVGAVMWAAAGGLIAYSSGRLKQEADDRKVPLMGTLGAFIFAAQMINFGIPATGSSGHLGGGMILSILLGPHAAFLVMASVLIVQALFFADGGLLALGCNIFNLGFFSCFVAYPLVYRKLAGASVTQGRIMPAAVLASVAALQLGAFGVVVETVLSGISAVPFSAFLFVMQPIHLAIGLVEGLVTAAVVTFVWKARPEIMDIIRLPAGAFSMKRIILGFAVAAAVIGGVLSWFASDNPDGLEWSVFKATGMHEVRSPEQGVHVSLAAVQKHTAFFPDYGFSRGQAQSNAGTSLAGLIGGALTLVLTVVLAWVVRRRGPVPHA